MNPDVESIISRIEQSKSIDSLNLSNRGLKMLPTRLGTLVHLHSLYLDNNGLIFVPEIGALTQLEELSLEANQITLLPESFGNLRALKTLNLSKNHNLKCLSGQIVRSLDQLTVLWLNECGLMYVPKEIGCLVGLEKLGLKSNRIEHIPEEFGMLTRLRWLSLENNLLADLPNDALKNLGQLSHLNLAANRLEFVPEFVYGLKKSLNVVSLRANLVKSLTDAEVLELSYLNRVDLRDNPFVRTIRESDRKFFNELKTLSNFIVDDDNSN